MKLSEIEAVSPEDFVIYENETAYSYTIDRGCKENAIEVDDFPKLYTSEQMQEYAKAKVAEALKACLQIKIPGRCNGKSAMISEQFKNIIDSIFEEDTKND